MPLSRAEQQELAYLESLEAQQQQQAPAPAPEQSLGDMAMGGLESLGQGLSMGFQDEMRAGVQSLMPGSRGYDTELGAIRGQQQQFAEQNPILDTGLKLGGNVISGIATGGAGANMVAREAALGGLEGYGTNETGNPLSDIAMGGVLGGVASKFGSLFGRPSASERVASGIGEVAERAEKRANKRLITRAQLTGGETAKRIEAGLETIPVAGGATKRIKGNFNQALNREAAASIGQDATKLTDDVLGQARSDIDNLYRAATSQGDIAIYPDAIDSLQTVINSTKKLPSRPDTAVKIGNNILEELRSGTLTADRYNELSQDVRGALFKAQKAGDGPNMKALSAINESLDDMVEKGLGEDALDAFKEARKLYRNYKVLTKGTNVINAEGDVSGKLLFNELAKGGNASKVAGTPLGDLAKLSKIPGVGDSGTASRALPAFALGAAAMGGADVSGSMIGGILGARALDEISQNVPGEALGILGGAAQRTVE